MSGGDGDGYLADGMTEELITHMGSLAGPQLGVLSRSSVMRFRSSLETASQIGRDLDASWLLEGSIARLNGRLHVTAELVRADSGITIWADTYDRAAADLFAIEREVARRVAERIAIRFLPAQEAALARSTTLNSDAYDAYLVGLYAHNRGTRDSFYSALAAFDRAIALDPDFALAHDGIARVYIDLAGYHFAPSAQAYQEARQHVDTALELDADLPTTRELQAVLLQKTNPAAPGLEQMYQAAIRLNPSDSHTRVDHALYLLSRKENNEAIAEMDTAIRLDPLSPATQTDHAWILFASGRVPAAQSAIQGALRLDPNFPYALYMLGAMEMEANRFPAALAAFRKAVESSGRTPKYLYVLADACIRAGDKSTALRLFRELSADSAIHYVPPEYLNDLSAKLN